MAGVLLLGKPPGAVDPNDGSAGAPSATVQYPNLLDGYSFIPTWNVAGVDYAVGYPTATTLKHPSSDTVPAGVTRNAGAHTFTITGDDVVLDAWDFSENGGWEVTATDSDNPTISNCKFAVGANGLRPINFLGHANGFTGVGSTITNCIFDGGGDLSGGAALDATVRISRAGTHVFQYNWVKNSNSDHIHFGGGTVAQGVSTIVQARYNIFEAAGATTDPEAHADWLQTFANTNYGNIALDYNTVIQNDVNDGGCQGFLLQANGNSPLATFSGGSASNNTVITDTGAVAINLAISYALDMTTGSWTITTNYIDPSNISPTANAIRADSNGGPHSGSATVSGNVNMLTGATLS